MYSLQANNRIDPDPRNPVLKPYYPYLLSDRPSMEDQGILRTLHIHPGTENLTDMALAFGEDMTVALSEISANLRSYAGGDMGAATSIYARRMQTFCNEVQRYQDALLEYREAVKSKSPATAAAKQKALSAFERMQNGFQKELSKITSGIRARKGLPLTNTTRALNIARSSRTAAKLHVMNQAQAHNLVQFAKYGRLLGNGLAVIDFGSRVGNIHNSYKAGGNWEREMFIESLSFALSTLTGAGTVHAGAAFLLMLTPAGWAGLIIGGIVATGAAAAVALTTDSLAKKHSGALYDKIMQWTDVL